MNIDSDFYRHQFIFQNGEQLLFFTNIDNAGTLRTITTLDIKAVNKSDKCIIKDDVHQSICNRYFGGVNWQDFCNTFNVIPFGADKKYYPKELTKEQKNMINGLTGKNIY